MSECGLCYINNSHYDGRLSRILELSLLHKDASICAQEKLGTTDFLTGRQSALPPVPHPLICPPCCLFQHCLIPTLARSSVTPPFCKSSSVLILAFCSSIFNILCPPSSLCTGPNHFHLSNSVYKLLNLFLSCSHF